jgi:hypothetical protein
MNAGKYRRNAYAAVMQFLRARQGQKFSAAQVSSATGVPTDEARMYLDMRANIGGSRVRREARPTEVGNTLIAHMYWIGEEDPAPGFEGNDAAQLRRWMRRHGRATRPSAIAKATGLDPKAIAKLLNAWHEEGTVVRCEIVGGKGPDRFEYRMALAPVRGPRAQPWVSGVSL